MARPTTETKKEPLVRAYAIARVPGGWVARTYVFPGDAALVEDTTPDTFSAAIGRVQRELAKEMK